MTTFFTSDLHYFHKNICKFTNRLTLEATVEEHTEWLTALWNAQVSPEDTIYHLGDFSFSGAAETANALARLNGYKIFLKGNHDKEQHMQQWKSSGLIQEYWQYHEIKILEIPACLFHFPITSWHKQGYGAYHLHGHSHGTLKDAKGLTLDVGIDSAHNIFGEHKFFTEEDVVQYMQVRKLEVADYHVIR